MAAERLDIGPIGIFDSGYGGLSILKGIMKRLPDYDYIYLGDNARAPYGTRSFEIVYDFTLQAVQYLFNRGCNLIILACNTASAKALRTIQQKYLPFYNSDKRVLGVIRPTVEVINRFTKNGNIGILATPGTVGSKSYEIEINKIYPEFKTTSQSCPMWVPLIENNDFNSEGARYFYKKDIEGLFKKNPQIDTVILGCTHYPLIKNEIKTFLPAHVEIVEQGDIVGASLEDYLSRHPEIERFCSKQARVEFLTTENPDRFNVNAYKFIGKNIDAKLITLK